MPKNNGSTLQLDCVISADVFTHFSLYDTFLRKKRWRSPALFLLIMGGFALVCFTLGRDREQSSLLGLVLLSVGLVVPTVYVLMYIFSVRNVAKKLKLGTYYGKKMYTITFEETGLTVTKGKETAEFSYEGLLAVVLKKDCAYLYADENRAFLLPRKDGGEEGVKLLCARVPKEKLSGRLPEESCKTLAFS